MSKKAKLPDIEKTLAELSGIVDKMEHSELSLEHSLKHFERGIALIQHARKVLGEAEQKVSYLTEKS